MGRLFRVQGCCHFQVCRPANFLRTAQYLLSTALLDAFMHDLQIMLMRLQLLIWPTWLISFAMLTCRTVDKRKKAVYHTNVMLCVGTDVAIVCAEGVTDDRERQRLLSSLGAHQTVSPTITTHVCFDLIRHLLAICANSARQLQSSMVTCNCSEGWAYLHRLVCNGRCSEV